MCTSNLISICCFAAPVPLQLPLGGWFGAGESPAATPSLCLEIPGATDAVLGKIHGENAKIQRFHGENHHFPYYIVIEHDHFWGYALFLDTAMCLR